MYPDEIYLDTETENELRAYIEQELYNHYAERQPHIEDLLRYQKDYWAKPTTEKAKFPFTGAATIVIPLSAIAIEAIHARTMTTMFALPQFVSASAVSADWGPVAAPLERFLDREMMTEMNIRKHLGDCFLEAEKFGTMIGKTGYMRTVKTAIRSVGGIEQEFDVVQKDGATFSCVPDARFLMPHGYADPQTAPWCGEEHDGSAYDLEQMELGGLFRPNTIVNKPGFEKDPAKLGKLRPYISASNDSASGQETGIKFQHNQEKLEKTEPSFPKRIIWHELWLAYNVDRDPKGRLKEIVVHYHRESKTFMSIRYNWHYDLRRPYRTGVYMPVEHRWRGIGICKQNEQFQREVTTQHRQRLDNATLANMRMIKVSKLSGYGPKEPVFPGKMWFLDDIDQIDTFQLGEIYPSSYSNEQATLIYSNQRTGVNEVTLGQPQVGTPGTATSDLARIQEGNKKFDFIYSNFKGFTNEIIHDTACTIQQFGPRRIEYFDAAEGGQLVKQFFMMPDELVSNGLLISLRTASQQQNNIMDRQDWQQITQYLQQYYMGAIQLAMNLGDPMLMQNIFVTGLGASTEAMRQILETFPNVRNVDRLIIKALENLNGGGTQRPGSIPGAANGNSGTDPNAAMAQLAAAFSQPGVLSGGASASV
jgi:hypothetical protein